MPHPAVDRRGIALTAMLALVLAGCQASTTVTTAPRTTRAPDGSLPPASDGTSPTTSATNAGPMVDIDAIVPVGTFTEPARPLDLSVETADDRAATAFIDGDGGTLTASGIDGTAFTLTLPRGAVWPPTAITMTPLASIRANGRSAGPTEVQGVQLEPTGLELLVPARLTITPAVPLDDVAYAAFTYHDRGADAALALEDPGVDGHVLPINHFSGAGIVRRQGASAGGDDESGQIEVLLEQVVSRVAEDRLAHQVGRAIAIERNAALLGQDPPETNAREVAEAAQWRFLEEVVKPRLDVAGHAAATCEDASALISTLLDAARQRQLLGLALSDTRSELDEAFDAVADVAYPIVEQACRRDAARACKQTGDIQAVVRKAILEQRTKALLGRLDEFEGPIPDFYQRILQWCAVYELTWASSEDTKAPNYKIGSRIEGHLKLRIVDGVVDPMNWPPRIEGETTSGLVPLLVSVTCSAQDAGRMICAPGAVGLQPTRARITKMEFGSVTRQQVGSQQVIANVPSELTILFQTSAMMLEYTLKPSCRCPDVNAALEVYATTFNTAHEPDQRGEFVEVSGWQRANHPLLWKKAYADGRRKEKISFKDTTVFELTHTPDPEPPAP